MEEDDYENDANDEMYCSFYNDDTSNDPYGYEVC